MRRLEIGVDLDGCVYDFVAALRSYLADATGADPASMPDATRWEFFEDWGLDLGAFLAACDSGVDAGVIFATGEPLAGSLESMGRLRDAGHRIHIVTDRSFGHRSEHNTLAWLADHRVPYDSVTFSADKTSVRTDTFIDDRPVNVDALRAVRCEAWLLDQGRSDQAGHPFLIASWAGFEAKVAQRQHIESTR